MLNSLKQSKSMFHYGTNLAKNRHYGCKSCYFHFIQPWKSRFWSGLRLLLFQVIKRMLFSHAATRRGEQIFWLVNQPEALNRTGFHCRSYPLLFVRRERMPGDGITYGVFVQCSLAHSAIVSMFVIGESRKLSAQMSIDKSRCCKKETIGCAFGLAYCITYRSSVTWNASHLRSIRAKFVGHRKMSKWTRRFSLSFLSTLYLQRRSPSACLRVPWRSRKGFGVPASILRSLNASFCNCLII